MRQYHYEDWPDNSNEASLSNFVNFAVQCVQWNTTAKSRTIAVHCRYDITVKSSFSGRYKIFLYFSSQLLYNGPPHRIITEVLIIMHFLCFAMLKLEKLEGLSLKIDIGLTI